MFMTIAIVVFIVAAVLSFAYIFAPYSEMMSSFESTKSFLFVIVSLVLFAGALVVVEGLQKQYQEWHLSAIYQMENGAKVDLYTGHKSKVSLRYNEPIKAGKPYETILISNNQTITSVGFLHESGERGTVQYKVEREKTQSNFLPIILTFPKDGKWKVFFYDEQEREVGVLALLVKK